MRALLQDNRTGKLDVADLPSPLLRPDGVIVRTAYSLISAGTERTTRELAQKNLLGKALARPDQVRQVLDVVRREGFAAAQAKVSAKLDMSRPLGYSSAGIVLEVGANVADEFAPGQRVACAGGGYANHAEVVYVPRNLCTGVPDGVSLEAAAFTTVGAIAMQGVRQADVRLGEQVAVIGLGLVGQLTTQILRAAGCTVVGIDLNPGRCQLAQDLGASCTVLSGPSTERAVRQFAPLGVDAVLLTAATRSSEPIRLAAELSRDRGRVVVIGAVGLEVPREPFYRKEIELRLSRSYGPGRYDPTYEELGVDYPIGYVRWTEGRNLAAFLDLLALGAVNVEPLVTHRFALEQAEQAYALVEGRTGDPSLGVVFTYPSVQSAPTSRVILAAPEDAKSVDRPGLGLIGAGSFATGVLLPALRKEGNAKLLLRGVASANGISARTVGHRFGFAFCARDAAEVLGDSDTQAVIIATRHDQHATLTVQALEAGKAVFVEKPLALNVEELNLVVAAQARARCPVLVGFNRRFSSLTQAVRGHFADCHEPLAITARVNAGFLVRDHWTQDAAIGGGRIRGEACHFVDLMSFLAGAPPVEVYGQLLADCGRYSGDNVAATIRFANGSIGMLLYCANGASSFPKERIEVLGGGRSAIIDDFREALLYEDRKTRRVRAAGQDKGHRREMAAFVDFLRRGGPSPVPFKDSVYSTLATLAILESVASGRTVEVDAGKLKNGPD